ncbi:MAG: choline-sulfatase [Acidimicrobiales bacterium]|nr:choline-sulfatase [Acidimicrobiales bacterium]
MTSRPNIVVIMADQLAPQFTATYGHPIVQTPHLDELAARGMRFDAAYTNSPLCAPARFAFMAGQLVTRIKAYDNAAEFPASVPTFAHYLRQAGYRTCLTGKMHFVGPDQLHGFEERLTTDVYPSDHAWTPNWDEPDERIDKWYHNMDSVKEAGTAATTFQLDFDEEVAFTAKRRIFEYAKYRDTPFAMVVSFIHPHDPYVARPEFWQRYDAETIDLPTSPVADDPHSRRLAAAIEAADVSVSDEQIANARRAYYANTTYIDAKIGEIVQTLHEAELVDDTIVVFTSDHGDLLGERGLWYKMSTLDHSMRIPLVLAGPGIRHGSSSEPCSLVDILPTMLDWATPGAWPTLGAELDGRSLAAAASGADADPEASALGEFCGEGSAHPIFMIRRGRWKYVQCDIDPPMLFDMQEDPGELTNRAADPAYATIEANFAAEVGERWDSAAIRTDVLASQRMRRAIHAAMSVGRRVDWDYQPRRDASEEYVRNHMDWTVAAATTRFPPIDGAAARS